MKSFVRLLEELLDKVIVVIFMFGLLFCVYCVVDDFSILDKSSSRSLLKYKPEGNSDEELGFKDLLGINEDVIGWITIDDTNIDYPVVMSEDNKEYLNLDVFGGYSLGGTPFVDYRNKRDFSDDFTIIYGHHMDMKIMFGGLDDFLDEDYLNKHKEGMLLTPDKVYKLNIISAGISQGFDEILFNPASGYEGSKQELLNRINVVSKSRVLGYSFSASDRIIMLATCTSPESYNRILVFGSISEVE